MFRSLRLFGVGLLAAALTTPLSAEPTPGPPEWADAGGSIYLDIKHHAPVQDESVEPAIQQAPDPPAAADDDRRLAPPTTSRLDTRKIETHESTTETPAASWPPMRFGMPLGSLYTMLSALAMVIGVFLIFAWLLRRGGRNTGTALPGEVVSVLGRVPLAARQFAHLLRVGNKLVLVTLTPSGAETITEVTDPVEVERIVGLCHQYNPHSTTKAFEQVFRQLSREATPSGFLGGDSLPQTVSSAASAYRAHRGESARA